MDWAWGQAPKCRLLHAGWTEYFFDGTELEVWGNKIEGARINYDGNLALSWQVLWKGPFILDQQLDGAKEPGEHLPSFLAEHSHRWKGEKSYLYLDSGCSAANYVNATDAAGFSAWSISYNKLTDKLEQLARQLPESAWRCWSGSGADGLIEQYAWPVASARGLCPGACVCGGAAQAVRGVVLQVWVCDVRTCGASQSGGGCLNGTRSRVPRNSVSANCSVIWTCSIRPVWN